MHRQHHLPAALVTALLAGALAAGCGSSGEKPEPYFTSGSNEADQRAQQRIAQAQQARGEGSGEEDADEEGRRGPLYERLGGDEGVRAIVDDFVARVLADPRVNWSRQGISTGGFAGIGAEPVRWEPSPENVERLKKHMRQFIAVATGGPAQYEGKAMTETHSGLQITNAEFDAAVGDLKSTLDKLGVSTAQQRELLAIVESTRAQVVEER